MPDIFLQKSIEAYKRSLFILNFEFEYAYRLNEKGVIGLDKYPYIATYTKFNSTPDFEDILSNSGVDGVIDECLILKGEQDFCISSAYSMYYNNNSLNCEEIEVSEMCINSQHTHLAKRQQENDFHFRLISRHYSNFIKYGFVRALTTVDNDFNLANEDIVRLYIPNGIISQDFYDNINDGYRLKQLYDALYSSYQSIRKSYESK